VEGATPAKSSGSRVAQALIKRREEPPHHRKLAAYYGPAREVGGDFYDFLEFPDGRFGLVVGDATGLGMPAALVMATTRGMLRAVVQSLESPGEVLARVNEALVADIPPSTFVTCFYGVLDPKDGHLSYANAGHNLPCRRHDGQAEELRARGLPLGQRAFNPHVAAGVLCSYPAYTGSSQTGPGPPRTSRSGC
jgi:serine phosphatase RsbU (regulator of sigma subunit)